MFETHEGLKNLYNVSCKELDYLVSCAGNNNDVIGSRLMGGGFGGCTINIIKNEAIDTFVSLTLSAYKNEFNIDAEVYAVDIVDGTHFV